MAEQTETEAACLLDHGSPYGKRVLLQPPDGDPIFAGFKQGAFSLYHGDAPYFHFDLEGRWQRALVEGVHYLKALDGTVQQIDRVREGANLVLKRKSLSPAEASAFDDRVRTQAIELIAAIESDRLGRAEPRSPARPIEVEDLRGFLERIAAWDASAWSEHRARYRAAYGPLPFIPPDCPAPVILQATLGDPSGRSFGGAAGSEHSVRTHEAFENHALAVAALFGRRIEQCKSILLGGADVLRRPVEDLFACLDIAARIFPIEPAAGPRRSAQADLAPDRLEGIHALLDQLDPPLPDPDAWRLLRAKGLVRVSLGVESGDPAIRARYGKTWPDAALRSLVRDLKAAAIGVGVLVLVGAGGAQCAKVHVDATADLLGSLDLGQGDLVSLLDAAELLERGAGDRLVPAELRPLTGAAFARQLNELRSRLVPLRDAKKAKVVPYSLEKQALA
jgi:hypothetical protein